MGKSLQPLNAMAVRPPVNTPAAAAPAASEPITAESLGWQLRAALPPLRLHSVSLYDDQANVLWLSEGALGPDEHNLVLEAMESLGNDRSLPCYEMGLEDGRVAVCLPVRAPQGDLVGVAMILADIKSVGDGVLERIVSPPVRTIMQKVAVLLRSSSKGTSNAEPATNVGSVPAGDSLAPAGGSLADRSVASRSVAGPMGQPVLELAPPRDAPARPAAPTAQGASPLPTVSAPPSPPPPIAKAAPAAPIKPATNNKPPVAPPPAFVPSSAFAPPAAATASPRAAAPAAPATGVDLSPQAIDDILEFELFPDVAAVAAPGNNTPGTPPAPNFKPNAARAWSNSDAGLELLADDALAPPVPTLAPPVLTGAAKPVIATVAPSRAAAPAKPASPQATPAPSLTLAATPPAAGIVVGTQGNAASADPFAPPIEAPAAAPPILASAPNIVSAQTVTPVAPVALTNGATGSPVNGAPDVLATTGISIELPINGAHPTATAAPATPPAKSTSASASSISKTLSSTGNARALNNGSATTGSVPAINTGATGSMRTLALDPSSLILDVQPFSKLRAGGRMRRYEVLPRIPHRDTSRAPAAMDGVALQRLLVWLGSNRSAWSLEPTSFSLNLSISTLEDPRFPQHVASCLKANGIAPDNLGFEIAEPLCTQHRAQVERFISLCDKLGCFVVIDDFSFDSAVLPLLRSKALRLVKIDPKLTSAALRDKLSQAMVVAIVQAVKVLGIHCAAKRVESQASLQWLTAIGCDLAQGPALSQVLPIESLNMPQPPPAPAAEPGKAPS